MKEELVLLAAKAGFRQHLDYYYHWLCDLQKWLREEHKWLVSVQMIDGGHFYEIEDMEGYELIEFQLGFSDTYEQALESGLKKALEKL